MGTSRPVLSDGNGAGRVVLVVDDDDTFRARLARALLARGFSVVEAQDHTTALAKARQNTPNYAVVDLKMPGASGLEVVHDLAAISRRIRTLVLTGYGSISSAVEAMRLGAYGYLSKPADADEIVAALTGRRLKPPGEFTTPSLERMEWEYIRRVLSDCEGNVSVSARHLGIARRTLQLKLKRLPTPE